MQKFKHSYSTLSTFETCPNMFLHKHVLKTIKFVQNEAAKYGSEGHDAMDKAIKANALPSGRWEFAAPYLQSIYNAANGAELKSEVEFGLTEDKQPVKFWDGWLRGKLDVGADYQNGNYLINDWKFAKFSTKYSLEMDVFSYLVMTNKPHVEKIKRVLVWMKQDAKAPPTIDKVSRAADFARIEDTVLGKIETVERALQFDTFPCRPSGLCSYCDVKDCKFWKPRKK